MRNRTAVHTPGLTLGLRDKHAQANPINLIRRLKRKSIFACECYANKLESLRNTNKHRDAINVCVTQWLSNYVN